MFKHTIPIPPTPLTPALATRFLVIFDHGAELRVTLDLARATDDPDHVTGTLTLDSETHVQDVVREE